MREKKQKCTVETPSATIKITLLHVQVSQKEKTGTKKYKEGLQQEYLK